MKKLGDLIKNYRFENSLSLREFANKCGFSHAYVDKLEKGIDSRTGKEVIPTIDALQKIARAMNIPLENLLKEIGYIEKSKTIPPASQLTPREEKDIAKRLEQMKKDLEKQQGLMFNGEPASPEAIESILSALEFGIRQAKIINKKYTPKKYRKD